MRPMPKFAILAGTGFLLCGGPVTGAVPANEVMRLYSGVAPGTETWTGPENNADVPVPGVGTFHIVTNISVPTVTVFRPSGPANGTAVLVAPGGGFQVLAWDMEGTEIAQWLASKGITAFVLKYRVRPTIPRDAMRPGGDMGKYAAEFEAGRKIAVADAIQAMRLIRGNASKYAISSDKVGMIGFSAGAMTTMGTTLEAPKDARPNFAAPIYGGMNDTTVSADAPPLFIAAAQDDDMVPISKSMDIFDHWQKAKRSAELHIYEKGGHGFGMRKRGMPVDSWPIAFETWLTSKGFLPRQAGSTEPR